MSSRLPHLGQATSTSRMEYVPAQAGLMHCWWARSVIRIQGKGGTGKGKASQLVPSPHAPPGPRHVGLPLALGGAFEGAAFRPGEAVHSPVVHLLEDRVDR